MSDDVAETREIVCATCECALDCCAFCDEEDCPKATCYRCVIVAVGQEMAQPHDHGG